MGCRSRMRFLDLGRAAWEASETLCLSSPPGPSAGCTADEADQNSPDKLFSVGLLHFELRLPSLVTLSVFRPRRLLAIIEEDAVCDRCCTATPIRVFLTRSPRSAGSTAWCVHGGIAPICLPICVLACSVAISLLPSADSPRHSHVPTRPCGSGPP